MSSSAHGHFVWHDLITTDIPSAVEFYKKVVGWKTQPFDPEGKYLMWTGKHGAVGGVGPAPEGVSPYWRVYIGTSDINATIVKALQLGGTVTMPVADIPNVGKWASLQDPQGNEFGLFWSAEATAPELRREPGEFNWHELATSDHQAAFAFYQQLFGWQHAIDHNIGDMGVYSVFLHEGRPQGMGGMYNAPATTFSGWRTYTIVKDAAKAGSTINRLGGVVTQAPEQVPGGSWILKFTDPQGAPHAFTAMDNSAVAKPEPVAAKTTPASSVKKPARKKAAPAKKKAATKVKVAPAAKPAKPKSAKKSTPSKKDLKKQKKKEKKLAKKLKKQMKKLAKQEKKQQKKAKKPSGKLKKAKLKK